MANFGYIWSQNEQTQPGSSHEGFTGNMLTSVQQKMLSEPVSMSDLWNQI